MTAGEHQPQPIVLEQFFALVERRGAIAQRFGDVGPVLEMFEALVAALLVDGLEAAGGDQPGHRILRQSLGGPFLHRRAEGIVQRFLGTLEIAQQADQRREDAARFLAVQRVDFSAYLGNGCGRHAAMVNGDIPIS